MREIVLLAQLVGLGIIITLQASQKLSCRTKKKKKRDSLAHIMLSCWTATDGDTRSVVFLLVFRSAFALRLAVCEVRVMVITT
jgi:hypothetical protein